jgi:hypothetical protein
MPFINLLTGQAFPNGNMFGTVTLMEYTNTIANPQTTARKFCYIIKISDFQKIFEAAGITLPPPSSEPKQSFWNRDRHPDEDEEYGAEICEDDNGDPNNPQKPVYLVYNKQWMFGHAQAQRQLFSGIITEDQANALDRELRAHDVP